jgi:uncharacterized protein DUF6644
MVTHFLQWLVNSPWSQALASSEWAFPAVQSLHFMGFALLIGTIAMVDLRLLGLGMRRQKPADIAADLGRWTWAGLAIIVTTGLLMFSGSATAYPHNRAFQFKMICLGLALLFHFTWRRRTVHSDVSGAAAKLTGAVSLLLWSAVVSGGRMIAFV